MSRHHHYRCHYSRSGHALHLIQFRLAYGASDPVPMRIVGEHETGIVVAPLDDPGHLEVWCMHQEWRDLVHEALAAGVRDVLACAHGLAQVDGAHFSRCRPGHWVECPAPEAMTPAMRGAISRRMSWWTRG